MDCEAPLIPIATGGSPAARESVACRVFAGAMFFLLAAFVILNQKKKPQ